MYTPAWSEIPSEENFVFHNEEESMEKCENNKIRKRDEQENKSWCYENSHMENCSRKSRDRQIDRQNYKNLANFSIWRRTNCGTLLVAGNRNFICLEFFSEEQLLKFPELKLIAL